jgi:hypothetical protein
MPEIGTSGSMSGDGKRSAGHWPQATAPILDSTKPADFRAAAFPSVIWGIAPVVTYTGRTRATSSECLLFYELPP